MVLTKSSLIACGVALLTANGTLANVHFESIRATIYANEWGWAGTGPIQTDLFNSIYMDPYTQMSETEYVWATASFTAGGQPIDAGTGRYTRIDGHGYTLTSISQGLATSEVDLWFTVPLFENGGTFSISCTGADSYVQIFRGGDLFASVASGGSLSGRLWDANSYHLRAYCSGNKADFSFAVPSPGPFSLALLGGGLLCSRRRRAAQ